MFFVRFNELFPFHCVTLFFVIILVLVTYFLTFNHIITYIFFVFHVQVINGHVVQTNETTYTDGNDNFKSYFHIKQIQVVPEDKTQKIANEKVITTSNYDSEAEKVETNEIKSDPSETIAIANAVADDNQNFIKKVEN